MYKYLCLFHVNNGVNDTDNSKVFDSDGNFNNDDNADGDFTAYHI